MAVERVASWYVRFRDTFHRVRTVATVRAFVIRVHLPVSADYEKIGAGSQQPVSGSSGQDRNVAGFNRHTQALDAAKFKEGISASYAECLMHLRMVMNEM